MRQTFLPYALAFREPVPTGTGTWRVRRGAWLRLEAEGGRTGLGEAAPLGGQRSAEAAAAAIAREPCGEAARDLARLDIEAQRAGVPLAELFGSPSRRGVRCNALCFASDVTDLCREAASAVAMGYRCLKIKVGVATADRDIERIRAVRGSIGAGVRLRIDANGAWDMPTALRVLEALEACGIEYVEDPVAGDAGDLRARTGIPVAVDIRSLDEGWRAVRDRCADFLVLKPMALGSLVATRALAVAAIEAEMGVVITSVFDTAVGVAGALHLAASLPGPEREHGLATVLLLEPAPLEGLEPPQAGELRLPAGPGLGVRLTDVEPAQALRG